MPNTELNIGLSLIYFTGSLLRGLGLILEFIGILGFTVRAVINSIRLIVNPWGLDASTGFDQIVYVIVAAIGAYIVYIGKRIKTKSADEVIKQDARPPVLYLRSFADDKVSAKQLISRLWEMAESDLMFSGTTEEETLAKAFERIGPCIALGRPGETLAPLGMYRMYFDDREWKEGIGMLLKQARLVILRAGSTESFFWEFREVIKNGLHPVNETGS
jgi:hypothetical protein